MGENTHIKSSENSHISLRIFQIQPRFSRKICRNNHCITLQLNKLKFPQNTALPSHNSLSKQQIANFVHKPQQNFRSSLLNSPAIQNKGENKIQAGKKIERS